ncbi:MAG: hypothetical protein Q8L89_07740 [Gammaproteobacteria bacterium]|jgi:hypothetical protein|nr:hypothetical protein [Gammaproteobacteria bacterium]
MKKAPSLGWSLLLAGIALAWLGLFLADALMLLHSALLHFGEHMQMLWEYMEPLPQALVVVGLLAVVAALGLFISERRRRSTPGEWY